MAESVVVTTQPRSHAGSNASRKLRKAGRLPAVVYGHKEETTPLSVSLEDILKVIHAKAHVVDLQDGKDTQKALIRELQWDHLGKDVLHVDFLRVSADERVEMEIPIALRGVAPGVNSGGVLDQPLHTLSVECLAVSAPDNIRVNIEKLQIGDVIHVRDLTVPEGVKVLDDPDAVVVQVTTRQEEPTPTEATAAEPEVITAKREEKEEE